MAAGCPGSGMSGSATSSAPRASSDIGTERFMLCRTDSRAAAAAGRKPELVLEYAWGLSEAALAASERVRLLGTQFKAEAGTCAEACVTSDCWPGMVLTGNPVGLPAVKLPKSEAVSATSLGTACLPCVLLAHQCPWGLAATATGIALGSAAAEIAAKSRPGPDSSAVCDEVLGSYTLKAEWLTEAG